MDLIQNLVYSNLINMNFPHVVRLMSHYNITLKSHIKVTRIKEMINN